MCTFAGLFRFIFKVTFIKMQLVLIPSIPVTVLFYKWEPFIRTKLIKTFKKYFQPNTVLDSSNQRLSPASPVCLPIHKFVNKALHTLVWVKQWMDGSARECHCVKEVYRAVHDFYLYFGRYFSPGGLRSLWLPPRGLWWLFWSNELWVWVSGFVSQSEPRAMT